MSTFFFATNTEAEAAMSDSGQDIVVITDPSSRERLLDEMFDVRGQFTLVLVFEARDRVDATLLLGNAGNDVIPMREDHRGYPFNTTYGPPPRTLGPGRGQGGPKRFHRAGL